jgi:hypothetical protein
MSGPVTLVFTDIEDSIGPREAGREAMAEVSARHSGACVERDGDYSGPSGSSR